MQAVGAAEGGGGSEGGGKVGAVGLLAPMLRLGTTVASSDHQHVLTIALPSLRSVAAAVTALSATLNLQQRLDALVRARINTPSPIVHRLPPSLSCRLLQTRGRETWVVCLVELREGSPTVSQHSQRPAPLLAAQPVIYTTWCFS
jgi:hypothetical protein